MRVSGMTQPNSLENKMSHVIGRICLAVLRGLTCFIIVTGIAHAGETLDRIERTGAITLTNRDTSIPFSYMDASGKPIGYTVDICMKLVDAISAQLKRPGLKVRFVQVNPSSRFPAIIEGKADLECGPTTNNAERRKIISFTIPNFIASAKMVVKANSGIKNWSDLRDRTVVTTKATTNAQSIAERNNVRALNIRLIEANDDRESFQKIVDGKADVFAMDDVLLYGLKANVKNPDDYDVVGSPLTVEPYAIMFSRQDLELKKIVDTEMARIIQSGEIYSLYRKWFNSPIPPNGANLNMPMNRLLRASFQFPSDKVAD